MAHINRIQLEFCEALRVYGPPYQWTKSMKCLVLMKIYSLVERIAEIIGYVSHQYSFSNGMLRYYTNTLCLFIASF